MPGSQRRDSRRGMRHHSFLTSPDGPPSARPEVRRTAGRNPARSSALRASASQTAATSASVGDGRGEDEGSSAQNGRGSAGSVRDMCGSVDHGCSSSRLRPAIRVRGTSAPWPVRWTVLCPSLLSRQPIIRKFFRKRREKHCAERCAHAQKIALFTCAITIRERKRTPHIVQRPSLGIPPVQVLQQRTQPAISEKTQFRFASNIRGSGSS